MLLCGMPLVDSLLYCLVDIAVLVAVVNQGLGVALKPLVCVVSQEEL